jgi:hypothetical protein
MTSGSIETTTEAKTSASTATPKEQVSGGPCCFSDTLICGCPREEINWQREGGYCCFNWPYQEPPGAPIVSWYEDKKNKKIVIPGQRDIMAWSMFLTVPCLCFFCIFFPCMGASAYFIGDGLVSNVVMEKRTKSCLYESKDTTVEILSARINFSPASVSLYKLDTYEIVVVTGFSTFGETTITLSPVFGLVQADQERLQSLCDSINVKCDRVRRIRVEEAAVDRDYSFPSL